MQKEHTIDAIRGRDNADSRCVEAGTNSGSECQKR